MFFHTLQIYQNVINKHHDKLVQLQHENRVHEVHEECQRICQPKGHDEILIETISCSTCHLGYIFSMNLDLVIAGAEINLGEHLSPH
jgi:ATP sulfurylase